jgi:hypothetical protein
MIELIMFKSLIITGTDIPKNIELLFGPNWYRHLGKDYEARLQCLLNPPPGSPIYASQTDGDKGASALSPGPASQTK